MVRSQPAVRLDPAAPTLIACPRVDPDQLEAADLLELDFEHDVMTRRTELHRAVKDRRPKFDKAWASKLDLDVPWVL